MSSVEARAFDVADSRPPTTDATAGEAPKLSSDGAPVQQAIVELTPDLAELAVRYLPADQLDHAPSPEPGWILDEDAFSEVGAARMVLRLWVSAQGRIDRVAVLHAEPGGPWVDRAILPLPETRMRPGERAGQAVASTVVVELLADLETIR